LKPHGQSPESAPRLSQVRIRLSFLFALTVAVFGGCGKSQVDEALSSDANGYYCLKCQSKFYTERTVFPTRCPQCKKTNIEQVMGFVCDADKQMTLGPRGRGAVPCSKCGKMTMALALPRENDMKSWGAVKKTEAEVTGP
jgi:hypothetical protein